MQYIDSRKPFDIEKPLGIDSAAVKEFVNKTLGRPDPGTEYGAYKAASFDRLLSEITPSMSGQSAYELLDEYGGHGATAALRDLGYDAIQHTGGAITGGAPHHVTIAFDPSQIYAPYIAPSLRNLPPLKRMLAAIAAYNASKGLTTANTGGF